MASLDVAEWTPDQVAEWLSGLGPSVERYVPALRARGLAGARLLTLRCDDLEALGVRAIGHQELVLEALDHLRNFQYELRRECVQQLALRVCVLAESVARALRAGAAGAGAGEQLDTQTLADVARCVSAVKPLVCWVERCGALAGGAGGALLALALEAAACAMRDRFAERPARAVAATARAAAALAERLVRAPADPRVLQPAALCAVALRQAGRPLGFALVASCCGHQQVGDIRFGSPAHASGQVHEGDEVVQVGAQCVVGWPGEAVARRCRALAAAGPVLPLRLRRRGAALPAPPPPAARARLRPAPLPLPLIDSYRCELSEVRAAAPAELAAEVEPAEPEAGRAGEARGAVGAGAGARRAGSPAGSSDGSGPLSPPASPTQLHPDHTRMYPPKPRLAARRRHSVSGGSPARARAAPLHQFWHELQLARGRGADGAGAGGTGPEPRSDCSPCGLYRRDKAVSCSTGLELGAWARPRGGPALLLCLQPRAELPAPAPSPAERARGRLDKSHSTPAYDPGTGADAPPGGPLAALPIPESPTTPTGSPTILVHSAEKADQILSFRKCSSQLGEAILSQQGRRAPDELLADGVADHAPLETLNLALLEHGRAGATSPLPAESPAPMSPPAPQPAPPSPPPRPAGSVRAAPAPAPAAYPALRPVPRQPDLLEHKEYSVLKRVRGGEAPSISVPLRHLTALPLRAPPAPAAPTSRQHTDSPVSPISPTSPTHPLATPPASVASAASPSSAGSASSVVRGMFPSAKSRSLKKKNSLLAKRRSVSARTVCARGAVAAPVATAAATGAWVWQRVRARHASQPRWARRHLLLAHNLLYAYRSPESSRADCMVQVAGWAVCAAGEVRSRAHAFKLYHTGTAFYFACESQPHMLAWIQLLHRATMLPALAHAHHGAAPLDVSKHFSETDYSETESDSEHSERRDTHKDKDKSKFGSLKKLTGRVARSESHESVAAAAGAGGAGAGGASLDRKYLRFFSRHRAKDDRAAKSKQSGVPVPTEHYRSYRRVAPAGPASPADPSSPSSPERGSARPTPINYIHASNPNLVDFEAGPWAAPPAPPAPPAPAAARSRSRNPENFVGFVTLEEFMLKKQEEERRQVYTNRVLMGIERTRAEEQRSGRAGGELAARLRRVVPDVIYGELAGERPAPAAPATPAAPSPGRRRSPPRAAKPISIKGKDGYEKIVYPEDLDAELVGVEAAAESPGAGSAAGAERLGGEPARATPRRRTPPPPPAGPVGLAGPERWRDSLRRNDKVHSGGGAAAALRAGAQPAVAAAATGGALLAADSWGEESEDSVSAASGAGSGASGSPGVSRLRLMFGAARATPPAQPLRDKPEKPGSGGGAGAQYPHLQCPPTFQPETYSLQLARRPAGPAAPAPPPRRAPP